MSRQLGSLHRSNSHPANLQTQIPIIPLFAFPPPDSPIIIIPSSMNSDTNSDSSVFHTISQFNNSNVETLQRQASLSEPTYNLYPTLPQDLNRIRHTSQNQNTVEVNRQIIHPRRNRNFQNPRVHFDIPQSPTPTTSEISSSTPPETPTLLSQHSTSSIPSGYLGSTPASEQIRENPFNLPPSPNPTERLPYWTTHSYTQGDPNIVNEPIDISSDTTLSSLPETLSLPSTP